MRIKEKIRNTIRATVLTNMLYFGGLVFFDFLAQVGSPYIPSSQIEEKISEERKFLNIYDKASIKFTSIEEGTVGPNAYSHKIKDNEYGIALSKGFMNLSVLRHELFHIADGHLEGSEESRYISRYFRTLFWEEPRAIFYSLKEKNRT